MTAKPTKNVLDIRSTESIRSRRAKKFFLLRLMGRPKITVVVALVLAVVVVIAAAGWFYEQSRTPSGQDEVKAVQSQVAKHYLLPSDEVPALATVTDKTKLKTPFFKRAENKDKILIYQKNKIAIIYRPSSDRIVAVGPVDIGTPPPSNQKSQ